MAMLRSVLGRVSRRLSGSFAAPSIESRRGAAIVRTPSLPSLHPAEPWMPRAGPATQLTTSFVSPAAAGAAAARTHGNLQSWQHFPVISKGARGMKWSEQKRSLSMERKESAVKRFAVWFDKSVDPCHEFMAVTFVGVSSFLATMIAYQNIGSHQAKPVDPWKILAGDLDGKGGDHSLEESWSMLGVWQS
ncbi:unnamed protein product [Urochloa humidicola]